MRILIENVDIITADLENPIIENGMIYIEDDRIRFVCQEMPYQLPVDKLIDGRGKVAMPGLINTHSHSPMTLMRGFAGDKVLEDWLFNSIIPTEKRLTPELIYWGSMLAICEMIKSGTTCFADMYFMMDSIAQAVSETGIRANIAIGPISHPSAGEEIVDEAETLAFLNRWKKEANGRMTNFIEIHSVYLYKEENIRKAAAFAKQHGLGIHMHLLETAYEKTQTVAVYGVDSVALAERCGMFDVPNLAAHCVHVSEAQMDVLARYGVSVAHNITSNLKLASGIAPIKEMQKRGINVTIGTDGAASNNNLNMFEEMHIAALVHKGVSGDATILNCRDVIRMATVNGAKALGLEGVTGCLKPGLKADLILLDMNKPHLQPVNDLEANIVYSAQGSDVDTVIVDGEILLENGKFTMIDEKRVMEGAAMAHTRLFDESEGSCIG